MQLREQRRRPHFEVLHAGFTVNVYVSTISRNLHWDTFFKLDFVEHRVCWCRQGIHFLSIECLINLKWIKVFIYHKIKRHSTKCTSIATLLLLWIFNFSYETSSVKIKELELRITRSYITLYNCWMKEDNQ